MTAPGGQEPVLDRSNFAREHHRIIDTIERVRARGGEGYVAGGRTGVRNPVKADTAPCLTAIVFAHRPAVILEMGTGYGFSALHFALAGTDPNVVTIEFDPTVAAEARRTFRDAGLDYDVRVGLVADAIDSVDHEIDLVFIDHQPAMYLPDFRAVEPKLSANAVILADNVNDRRAENAAFTGYVLDKYGGTILPTRAGLLYSTVSTKRH